MLGFGKKKKQEESKEKPKDSKKDKKPKQPVIQAAVLGDEKFTIMPKQYLPQKGKSSGGSSGGGKGINKKLLFLIGGSILILAALSAVLYFVLFSGDKKPDQPASQPVTTQPPTTGSTPASESPQDQSEEEEVQDKIISGESYDELNQLAGVLTMTIPSKVVETYGNGMGITVLSESDISLSEEESSMGGIYSLYPVAITFSEPISLELSVADIPSGVDKEDIYPAYLRGANWSEIEDYQVTLAGFSFMFDKFPTGPITAVFRSQAQDTGEAFEISPIIPSRDTDTDGLTDKEEELFGTSSSAVDSDEDTYSDKDEVFNGYSPTAGAGVKLEEGDLFLTYTNSTYGYKAPYPSGWLADSLDQTNKQVLFISDTEEFFEILIEENPLNTPIVDWYRGQSPSLRNIDLDITILASRPAVWSPDKMTLYTSKDGLVYILTYNKGTLEEINWPNIFEYFYKNFSFGNTNSSNDIVDCGTAGPVTFESGEPSDIESGEEFELRMDKIGDVSDETRASWECFTDNLPSCTPTVLSLDDSSGLTAGSYTIIQKNGDVCNVSGPSFDIEQGLVTTICGFTDEYINSSYSTSETDYPNEEFIKGFSAMSIITFHGSELENPDGTKFILDCNNLSI